MGVRTVTVYVAGDITSLSRNLAIAGAQVDKFVGETQAKGGKLGDFLSSGIGKGFVVAGVGIAAGLAAATAAAIPFDAAMHNVATISTEVQNNLGGAEQQILSLSTTVPQSATNLAKGLYEIVSSNFQAADAFHVLDVSAKAASAGLTDTDTSARAITGALNAYGLSAASAGDVSDILFQTVNKGVVTFHDLAQNLGDFVGTAASAKVPLQDVASAYAAITLAGVPAAEAATSVNQLLTKLIKPTSSLSAAYKQLGYESGASALQQKGLQGVIKDIGRVTGGSTEALVRMFNDVRAARGVLALLSADGKNYQAAIDGIANAESRTGATQRAFNEQMKSTQAQLQLLLNDAEAFGIGIGLKILPPLNAFIAGARDAGGNALPFIEAALNRVGPLFQQVWAIAGNLGTLLVELARDAAPFAAALAGIGGALIVEPLRVFLGVLKEVTGFLADHRQVVEAVAAVYLARLIPGLVAAGAAMVVQAAKTLYLTATTAAYVLATDGAAAATARLGSASGLASVGLTAGLAVAIFAVTRGISQWNDAQEQAKKSADDIRHTFDAYDTTKATQQLDQLRATAEHGIEVGQQYDGVWGRVKAGFSEVAGDGSVGKVAAQGEEAAKAYADLSAKLQNTQTNLTSVASATGLTVDAVKRLAQEQNIDLSGTFDSSADARKRLIEYIGDLKHQDNVTAASIASNANFDEEAMKALQDAIEKVVKAATSAFSNDTDVLGQFASEQDQAAKKVASAQEALGKARKTSTSSGASSLADEQRIARDRANIQYAEQRATIAHSKTIGGQLSQQQSIRKAQQKLADDEALIAAKRKGKTGSTTGDSSAAQRLAEAQAEAANVSLSKSYAKAIDLGEKFTRDINSAVQRGLDPNVIGKLLQEGPAKAEPALQAILSDHSGHLLTMVNASERELSHLTEFVAEQARLAAIALNAPTDQYTHDLKTAMGIAAQEAATGGRATVQQLAKALRVSQGDIRRTAQEFGQTIVDGVQGYVDTHPILARLAAHPREQAQAAQAAAKRAALGRWDGGEITWGPPGRDASVAAVTKGEWVQPTAAVQHYGTGFMEAVRTRTFPRAAVSRFWDGGLVGTNGALVSSVLNVGGPRVLPVPVPVASRTEQDNSVTYNIDKVIAGSVSDLDGRGGARTYSAMRGVS